MDKEKVKRIKGRENNEKESKDGAGVEPLGPG